ncbi:MAG: DUF4340 domain-containing protein [Cyanobacteria bacterium P01_D01_bin.1]
MLNRGTLLLLVSAIALGGGVLLFENRGSVSNSSKTSDAQGKPLVPFEESAVIRFELDRAEGDNLAFFKDESGAWQMSAPEAQVAEESAIAFLLSQLTRASNRVIDVDSGSLADFGLDDPEAIITLEAENSSYQLLIGSADFGGDQRYVQAKNLTTDNSTEDVDTDGDDAAADLSESKADQLEEIEIHLIAGGIMNAIKRPTIEWLMASQEEFSEWSSENETSNEVEALSENEASSEVEAASEEATSN